MTQNVNDIHSFNTGLKQANERIKNAKISKEDIDLLKKFNISCRNEGLKKSTIAGHLNICRYIAETFIHLEIDTKLHEIDEGDFWELVEYLEEEKRLSKGTIRNYKKTVKKLFRWYNEDEPPKWVKNLKLEDIDSTIQPHEILNQDEVDKILDKCKHPRDKAFIAVLADGGLRVGAAASCQIKHVEFSNNYAMLYISKTSQSRKNTTPKGIPLTWSTGYLNQWYSIHPSKGDPEAPLWITLDKNQEPMSYNSWRKRIKNIAKSVDIKKDVNPHAFRHYAITNWILDGLSEQEIKHRAGWSKGSDRMFKVYGNFTDKQINDGIYQKYGIETNQNKRHVKLENCSRCGNILKPTDKFCSRCALVLDQDSADELKYYNDKMSTAISKIMNTEEGRKLFDELQKGK
jgi:integrase